jgi:hypothetical protein
MGIEFVFDAPAQKQALQTRLDRVMADALGASTFEKLMGRPAPGSEAG